MIESEPSGKKYPMNHESKYRREGREKQCHIYTGKKNNGLDDDDNDNNDDDDDDDNKNTGDHDGSDSERLLNGTSYPLGNATNGVGKRQKKDQIFGLFMIIVTAVSVGSLIALFTWLHLTGQNEKDTPNPHRFQHYIYQHAAVATDSLNCSKIGVKILQRGGNAIDSAIASSLCLGVLRPYASGIGGGGFMLIHLSPNDEHHSKERDYLIDYREKAGKRAEEGMFIGREHDSEKGALAIAVPGQIAGLYHAHQKFGKLNWKDLFTDAIHFARNGFYIDDLFAIRLNSIRDVIMEMEGLKQMYTKFENGNRVLLQQGDFVKFENLANTLEKISELGPSALYHRDSPILRDVIQDIQQNGGILTVDDFVDYSIQTTAPHRSEIPLDDSSILEVLTGTIPSSGPVINFMLQLFFEKKSKIKEKENDDLHTLDYHYMLECLKHGFAHRMILGDEIKNSTLETFYDKEYIKRIAQKINDQKTYDWSHYMLPEFQDIGDHGTTHLSIVDEQGNTVSMTESVNWSFGSKLLSQKTGILFNNHMNDFTINPNKRNSFGLPPSHANFIAPGRRAMSSMAPVIILDKSTQNVIFSIGSSGGPTIISTVFEVLLESLVLAPTKSMQEIIDMPRFHEIVGVRKVLVEEGAFSPELMDKLTKKGHIPEIMKILPDGHTVGNCQAIRVHYTRGNPKSEKRISAGSDLRKFGKPDGYRVI